MAGEATTPPSRPPPRPTDRGSSRSRSARRQVVQAGRAAARRDSRRCPGDGSGPVAERPASGRSGRLAPLADDAPTLPLGRAAPDPFALAGARACSRHAWRTGHSRRPPWPPRPPRRTPGRRPRGRCPGRLLACARWRSWDSRWSLRCMSASRGWPAREQGRDRSPDGSMSTASGHPLTQRTMVSPGKGKAAEADSTARHRLVPRCARSRSRRFSHRRRSVQQLHRRRVRRRARSRGSVRGVVARRARAGPEANGPTWPRVEREADVVDRGGDVLAGEALRRGPPRGSTRTSARPAPSTPPRAAERPIARSRPAGAATRAADASSVSSMKSVADSSPRLGDERVVDVELGLDLPRRSASSRPGPSPGSGSGSVSRFSNTTVTIGPTRDPPAPLERDHRRR